MINIQEIFDEVGIEYRSDGKNVGIDDININCPFCDLDPSYHCGINTISGIFHCWICGESGNFQKLIFYLSKKFSNRNIMRFYNRFSYNNMSYNSQIKEKQIQKNDNISNMSEKKQKRKNLNHLFFPLQKNDNISLPYIEYGKRRGISFQKLKLFNASYGINEMSKRIVFPIQIKEQRGIIGRAIEKGIYPKWKKIKEGDTFPFIFGLNKVIKSDFSFLFICEGIFDMLKFPVGSAIALLSKRFNYSIALELMKFDKKIILALDSDVNITENLRWKNLFEDIGLKTYIFEYINGYNDFGEMDGKEILYQIDWFFRKKFKLSI